jgi:hypothetical protein
VIACQLVGSIGYKGHLGRFDLADEICEAGDWVALDIKLGTQSRLEVPDILVAYVALIGTRVYRDALGAKHLAVECHVEHIGIVAATCVAEGSNLVDIDTKSGHKLSDLNIVQRAE